METAQSKRGICQLCSAKFSREQTGLPVGKSPAASGGVLREQMPFPATATAAEIEAAVLASDFLAKHGEGKAAKKAIVVPSRMVKWWCKLFAYAKKRPAASAAGLLLFREGRFPSVARRAPGR